MRKINKNIFVFAFYIIVIICGIQGKCFQKLVDTVKYFKNELSHGNIFALLDISEMVDSSMNNDIFYHDVLVDINSIKENILGTRIVPKGDTTVIKSDEGSLLEPSSASRDEDLNYVAEQIQRLEAISKENGADFLYCLAPAKEIYYNTPSNVVNNIRTNYYKFKNSLDTNNIPYIELAQTLDKSLKPNEIFFYTDHHWKPYAGFLATKAICDELKSKYNFEYNDYYTDINNYTVTTYKDFFLGSYGKKVGRYFTWNGADDFDLIVPKFETNMTERQPLNNEVKTGSFKDTVLFLKNLEKNYYHRDCYLTYSGGNFRLQIMNNNLNVTGKKILLIRNSYACVVAPFLALNTSELHICDVRNGIYLVGDKLNMEEYIKEIKPDFVLVLYQRGVGAYLENNSGNFDFF